MNTFEKFGLLTFICGVAYLISWYFLTGANYATGDEWKIVFLLIGGAGMFLLGNK